MSINGVLLGNSGFYNSKHIRNFYKMVNSRLHSIEVNMVSWLWKECY